MYLFVLFPLMLQPLFAKANCLTYSTTTVTTCSSGLSSVSVLHIPPSPEHALTVAMPGCPNCGCDSCTHTSTYTTRLNAFCPTGVVEQIWTIEEIYSGMSSFPVLASPTSFPHGFTTTVETCSICPDPISETITYPSGGSPYAPLSPVAVPPASKTSGDAGPSNHEGVGVSINTPINLDEGNWNPSAPTQVTTSPVENSPIANILPASAGRIAQISRISGLAFLILQVLALF